MTEVVSQQIGPIPEKKPGNATESAENETSLADFRDRMEKMYEERMQQLHKLHPDWNEEKLVKAARRDVIGFNGVYGQSEINIFLLLAWQLVKPLFDVVNPLKR